MAIKGIVFDFDGVIVNSPKIYTKTMREFIQKQGITLTDSELSRLISFSMRQEFDFLREKHALSLSFEEFMKGTLSSSKKIMENELELMAGAKELLQTLYSSGFSIGLASNNNRSTVDWGLKKFGLEKYFHSVVPIEIVAKPKPAGDVYLKNAEVLSLLPSECVGVEDTVVGCKAVKNAGFKCVGLRNEFSDESSFEGANLVVSSLEELTLEKLKLLGGKK